VQYTIVFYIRGVNPSKKTILDYAKKVTPNGPNFYISGIINVETFMIGESHFETGGTYSRYTKSAKGLPLETNDNGFGVMQLTNPVPTYVQMFNWKKNVEGGVDLFKVKIKYAKDWINKQKRQCNDDLKTKCPLITTKTLGKCVFSDDGSSQLTFVDAVAIKYYNGGTASFVSWDNSKHEWKFSYYSTVNGKQLNYVEKVCSNL
jgi:hypothetical protein